MNFFEQQDQAKKQTRWLVAVFVLAVIAVAASVNLVLLLVLGATDSTEGAFNPFTAQSLYQNKTLLLGGGIASISVISLASLFKTMSLRSGGGQVARDLGGSLVESDPRDPLRRRFRNVVEEIALASGVPVPEMYVLEQESGINAFAAGYSPSDAVIAVTRGTLEKLNRSELQGVVAHEFSHILNGDMRINIRLMGALFGILLLALIGRRVLIHTHHFGRSRDKNGAAILLIAFGLMAVGYVGQFFGRWIKAAISRQREYLADASAVQFTRDPDGIGGALKKIAVYSEGSHLSAETEEVSHMLFGDGRKMNLFSTHPPLNSRIQRIEPSFQPEDLKVLSDRIAREHERRLKEQTKAREKTEENAKAKEAGGATAGGGDWFGAGGIIDQIGNPDFQRILMAAAIAASIPENIKQSAQSTEWAPEVLFYSLLDADQEVREQQLLLIARTMGADSEAQVRALMNEGQVPTTSQRLPLMELSFPALKRRPPEYVTQVLETVNKLVQLDGRIDVFEYLMARVITQHLWESQNPHLVKAAGRLTMRRCLPEASRVLAVLAVHGHDSEVASQASYHAGMKSLVKGDLPDMPLTEDWVAILDGDLKKLDELRAMDKQVFVDALLHTVSHDRKTVPVELELLRVICSMIHVPLPMLIAQP
jgi:Zn-dependent protease with chaperone function